MATKAEIQKELDELKSKVTTLIMDHNGCEGCLEGRVEALESLGLSMPTKKHTITINFEVPQNFDIGNHVNPGDISDLVAEWFECYENGSYTSPVQNAVATIK